MNTLNIYKYEVVTRWKYDTEYQTEIVHSLRKYRSLEDISRTYHNRKVVLGYRLIEPTLCEVIEENKIKNWN